MAKRKGRTRRRGTAGRSLERLTALDAAGLRAVLLALYAVREGQRTGELLQAAPDFPEETAGWAWERWRRASDKGAALPEEFVRRRVPEWSWLLGRRRSE